MLFFTTPVGSSPQPEWLIDRKKLLVRVRRLAGFARLFSLAFRSHASTLTAENGMTVCLFEPQSCAFAYAGIPDCRRNPAARAGITSTHVVLQEAR